MARNVMSLYLTRQREKWSKIIVPTRISIAIARVNFAPADIEIEGRDFMKVRKRRFLLQRWKSVSKSHAPRCINGITLPWYSINSNVPLWHNAHMFECVFALQMNGQTDKSVLFIYSSFEARAVTGTSMLSKENKNENENEREERERILIFTSYNFAHT